MADPWIKFYPTDWRSDPALRMCSMAARGLWIEMIALMHEATPYGHLLVSGRSPTDAQLAVLAGAPSDQIPELLGELDSAGVFSRTREGVIYSRKMTRTAKKAAIARKNGKNGGNPTLLKERENRSSVKGEDKGEVKTQKPETRSQISKDGSYDPLSSGDDDHGAQAHVCDESQQAGDACNSAAGEAGWPQVQKLTPARRSALKARLQDAGGLAGWALALEKARASPHLCGQNDRGWVASFDFLARQSSFTKLMEGSYDQRPANTRPRSSGVPYPGRNGQPGGLVGAAMRSRTF